ncbi:hypothetical protein ACQKNC_05065 [Lysinibacillus sp. NPDC094177]|uniref:hypothetical protein n=1 Tax=Lysinibacillus sp. NPDC094177 TaxID=3390580 RepID=UPI003D003AD0
MSSLGQQVFFARKRSANVAAAKGGHSVRKRSATKRQQQQDVGHEGVITGHDALSFRSSIADPQGVAQSPSNQLIHIIYVIANILPNFW